MLEVTDIHFGYRAPVLKGLTIGVREGELLALLGPNGAGKTTLVKLIVGLLRPAAGKVVLDGRDLHAIRRRDAARLIGYVAQESAIVFPLTAMEYVLQGRFAQGRLVGFENETDVNEARRVMEQTETASFASRLIQQLSGGERQRIMLARALVSRPRLLVLDEPVANLDISHQVKVLEFVRSLTDRGGMAAVIVTHELNLASEFASSIALLKSGKLVAHGAPADVMDEGRLCSVFDTRLAVDPNPSSGAPRVTISRSTDALR